MRKDLTDFGFAGVMNKNFLLTMSARTFELLTLVEDIYIIELRVLDNTIILSFLSLTLRATYNKVFPEQKD